MIDILIDEVKEHERILIEENKKPFKPISYLNLKGLSSKKEFKENNKFYDEIFLDILDSANNQETILKVAEREKNLIDRELIRKIHKKNSLILIVINFEAYNNKIFLDEKGDKYNKEDSEENNIENINKLKLDIITESFIGLQNIGNTCYLNSALQILIHCKESIKDIQHQ